MESKQCDTYQEAVEHAESAYWVLPVWCASEEVNFAFSNQFKVTDTSASGLVHYERRKR